MIGELLCGIGVGLRIPIIPEIAKIGSLEEWVYYCGWGLFFGGILWNKNKTTGLILNALSSFFLFIACFATTEFSIIMFLLSMVCFGASFSSYYPKITRNFHLGSFIGCTIGIIYQLLSEFLENIFAIYYLILLVSIISVSLNILAKIRKQKRKFPDKGTIQPIAYLEYPPHKVGIFIVICAFDLQTISIFVVFVQIPILAQRMRIFYLYLWYAVLSIFGYLAYRLIGNTTRNTHFVFILSILLTSFGLFIMYFSELIGITVISTVFWVGYYSNQWFSLYIHGYSQKHQLFRISQTLGIIPAFLLSTCSRSVSFLILSIVSLVLTLFSVAFIKFTHPHPSVIYSLNGINENHAISTYEYRIQLKRTLLEEQNKFFTKEAIHVDSRTYMVNEFGVYERIG